MDLFNPFWSVYTVKLETILKGNERNWYFVVILMEAPPWKLLSTLTYGEGYLLKVMYMYKFAWELHKLTILLIITQS